MKTRPSGVPFGQIAAMVVAVTLLLGMAAGLHALAGDDVAQTSPLQEAAQLKKDHQACRTPSVNPPPAGAPGRAHGVPGAEVTEPCRAESD